MPKIPGINHKHAIKALKKAGFEVVRQGKHIVISDGIRIITIPRANPIKCFYYGWYCKRCWFICIEI
jgi:hypothetical protein